MCVRGDGIVRVGKGKRGRRGRKGVYKRANRREREGCTRERGVRPPACVLGERSVRKCGRRRGAIPDLDPWRFDAMRCDARDGCASPFRIRSAAQQGSNRTRYDYRTNRNERHASIPTDPDVQISVSCLLCLCASCEVRSQTKFQKLAASSDSRAMRPRVGSLPLRHTRAAENPSSCMHACAYHHPHPPTYVYAPRRRPFCLRFQSRLPAPPEPR